MKNVFYVSLPNQYYNLRNCDLFEVDKTIKTNPWFSYVVANQAKEFFKTKILNLDQNHEFMKQNLVLDVDPKIFEIVKNDYTNYNKDNIALANEAKTLWKQKHKDYYRMQTCLPSSKIYSELGIFDFIMNITLDDAIQGYKYASELLKELDEGDQLDKFCTELKPMLNYEHREEYNAAMNEINQKFNVHSDAELKETLSKTLIPKNRLALDRSKCIDLTPSIIYVTNVLDNFINKF